LAENNGRYPNSHSLLIKTDEKSNEAVLFDSGVGRLVVRKLMKDFKIKKVFLSHWHEDHISGNYVLKRRQAEFFCHSFDIPILNDITKFQVFYATLGSPVEEIFQDLLVSMKIENMIEINEVVHNQEVRISDNLKIKVLHTPGHSSGHCCYYEPERGLIFLADIDLSGLGPWYGCIDSDIDEFEKSIKELMRMKIEYAVSSHKGVFIGKTVIKEKLSEYLKIIYQREENILSELSEVKPKVIEELIGKRIIYKNYNFMKEYLYIAEKQMLSKHVIRLARKQKISKVGQGFILR
jgi:glyoxylase-like metal-dependent hydrolase (beta-lactamase superfamily II)